MLEGDPVIINYKHPHLFGDGVIVCGPGIVFAGLAESYFDSKSSSDALFTFYVDLPVHQFDKALGDRHAQPRAAIPAAGCLTLLTESVKNVRQIIRSHADAGIRNREDQGCLAIISRPGLNGEIDAAAFRRKFDRISENVDEDLSEFQGIANVVVVDMA